MTCQDLHYIRHLVHSVFIVLFTLIFLIDEQLKYSYSNMPSGKITQAVKARDIITHAVDSAVDVYIKVIDAATGDGLEKDVASFKSDCEKLKSAFDHADWAAAVMNGTLYIHIPVFRSTHSVPYQLIHFRFSQQPGIILAPRCNPSRGSKEAVVRNSSCKCPRQSVYRKTI